MRTRIVRKGSGDGHRDRRMDLVQRRPVPAPGATASIARRRFSRIASRSSPEPRPTLSPAQTPLETPPRRPRKPCGMPPAPRRGSPRRSFTLQRQAHDQILVRMVADHERIAPDTLRSRSAHRSAAPGDCRRKPTDRARPPPRRRASTTPSISARGDALPLPGLRARRIGGARSSGRVVRTEATAGRAWRSRPARRRPRPIRTAKPGSAS